MSYIRIKTINGNDYLYEQESFREGNKVKSRHVKYIGKVAPQVARYINYNNSETKTEIKYSERDLDTVAKQKYNVKELNKLGEGRDRIAYELPDGNVLKIAKNEKGLIQNDAEADYSNELIPKTLEVGKDYIIKEKVDRNDTESNKMLKGLKKFSQIDFDRKDSKLQEEFSKLDSKYLDTNFSNSMNYDLMYGDFIAGRNWGWKGNRPYLLDGGTLNKSVNDKDSRNPFISKQWNEVLIQRKSKNLGTTK